MAEKCKVCQRRKGQHQRRFEGMDHDILVCERCRREFWPTPEEDRKDRREETYRAERSAELAACDYEARSIDY